MRIYEIEDIDFNTKSSLIKYVTDTLFSEEVCPGADRGLIIYCCYQYNQSTSSFRQIWLSEEGDCHMENLDPCAIELDLSLKNIQREIGFYPIN